MLETHGRLNGHEPAEFRSRFKILIILVTLALFVLMARLWYLQVIKGEELGIRSESNSVRLRTIRAVRGFIMDRNRNVLVDNLPSFDIMFVPNRAKNVQDVARKMEAIYAARGLPFSPEVLMAKRISAIDPIKVEKNVSREKLALIEAHALELPGVVSEVVTVRQYLGGEKYSHIIGYLGEVSPEDLEKDGNEQYTGGDMVGKYGIEKYLDQHLRGKNGAEQVEVNVVGKEKRVRGKIIPVSGDNVVLTIDSYLQEAAWDALEGKPGAIVVMDVRDGSILAMVSSPSFDPNLFRAGISARDWKKLSSDPFHPLENRAISGQYPPGSTYKLIVAAAALEEGIVTPSTSFNCSGSFDMGNRKFHCWNKKGHGRVSLHRAIVQSCDVYFYNVGKLLGVDKIAEYSKAFGFGSVTGIDLPREKPGIIPTRKWKLSRFKVPWQVGETISVAIGQGFNTVTPLQLVGAYAALANGGTVWKPRIIKQIESVDGKIVKAFTPERKGVLPLSKDTMEELRSGLWGVVNEGGGTGSALRRKEADVAGKTGTSQVVGLPQDEKGNRTKKTLAARFKDHALFVCFAPYKSPEIAVAVIAENAGGGGSVAAPIARKIVDAYFQHKQVPPGKQQVVRVERVDGTRQQ